MKSYLVGWITVIFFVVSALVGTTIFAENYGGFDYGDDTEVTEEEAGYQDSEESYIQSGDMYFSNHMYEEAAYYYQNAIQSNPENDDSYVRVGECYFYLEKYDQALYMFKKALELNPENYEAFEGLSWIYLNAGRYKNFRKALRYAKQAVMLSYSEDCDTLDTLSEAYYFNGLYDAAISTARVALELCPTDPIIQAHMVKYERSQQMGY